MKMSSEDLAQVKQCMDYSGDDMTPDNALSMLMSHVKSLKTKVGDTSKMATLSAAAEEKDVELAKRDAKILELSTALEAKTPKVDMEALADRAEMTLEKIELSIAQGDLPAAIGQKLIKSIKADGKPNVFMLSRSEAIDARPANFILGLFKGEKLGTASGSQTGVQTLSRLDPDKAVEEQQKKGNPLLDTAKAMTGTK